MSLDDFDHPCKQTCSGWKQGFDKGYAKALKDATVSIEHKVLIELQHRKHKRSMMGTVPISDERALVLALADKAEEEAREKKK